MEKSPSRRIQVKAAISTVSPENSLSVVLGASAPHGVRRHFFALLKRSLHPLVTGRMAGKGVGKDFSSLPLKMNRAVAIPAGHMDLCSLEIEGTKKFGEFSRCREKEI